ncbi:hypothetical protein RN001_005329 [Aquatica leii]|uniref:BD-FAE-like domain-containing protein n=1 Tax=Aquatica leii TaxID=1421715 RepID=A0AAN7P6F6_9COLE|nr:hypothetical protein RN001_005329 [Aquatica leii]
MFSKEELELQYTPRQWSKRGEPEEVIQLHIEICRKASAVVKENIPCQLDIPYGSTEREKIDVYGIDLPSDAPIFIFLHGGYWQTLSKEQSAYIADQLYKHGVKVIVLGYNLCPNVPFSSVVEGTQNALAYCLKYAKEQGSRGIYLCGHSAGGHLVASMFQQAFHPLSDDDKNMIKGAFMISGIFDLIPIVDTTVNINLKLNEEEAKKFSPLFHTMDAAPHISFLVIVGEYESAAFHKQSTLLHNKLKSNGYKSQLIIAEKVDHFNIVENFIKEDYVILKTILNIIENKPSTSNADRSHSPILLQDLEDVWNIKSTTGQTNKDPWGSDTEYDRY